MKGASKKSEWFENPSFMTVLTKDLRCVLMRLRNHYPEFVEKLRQAVRIPSEVTSPKHCFAMLDWAKENLEDLGFYVLQVENPETTQMQGAFTYPFLLASSENAASDATICAYFHLDVESVERDEDWSHPPFGGVKEEGCIFGKGSSWGKGPFVAWLSALNGYRSQGLAFPIKIKFVIECGGTSGSPGFRKLLEDEKVNFFADVNGLFMSEGSWLGETTPCLVLGGKGACEFSVDIVCAAFNVDSELNGGIIHEAMTDMIYLLNSLIDDHGNMLIPCIEQGVLAPTEAEIKSYDGVDLDASDLTSRFGLRDSASQQQGNVGLMLASLWRQPHLRLHSVNSCYPRGSIDHIIPDENNNFEMNYEDEAILIDCEELINYCELIFSEERETYEIEIGEDSHQSSAKNTDEVYTEPDEETPTDGCDSTFQNCSASDLKEGSASEGDMLSNQLTPDEARERQTDQCGTQPGESDSDCDSENPPSDCDSENPPSDQHRKVAHERRVLGKTYLGYKTQHKDIFRFIRPKKSLPLEKGCSHSFQQKKPTKYSFYCYRFTQEDRKFNFNHFWAIPTWTEKKAFLKGLVTVRNIRKRRPLTDSTENTKKNIGHDIHLPRKSGDKLRVCRKFLLMTLQLGENSFKRWLRKDFGGESTIYVSPSRKRSSALQNDEASARRRVGKKEMDQVRKWLDLLPKVPSHYCRASTSKTYVDSTFRSISHMHEVYLKWCTDNNFRSVRRAKFTSLLTQMKVAIHSPRKDQCNLCIGYKVGSVTPEEYELHIEMKNSARIKKNYWKDLANNGVLVVTMDLQSVLVCPKNLASAIYYKQKLQVHNFSLYELNQGHVELYVWHEGNAGVTSNEFTSCLMDYINKKSNYRTAVFISDGCCYQNRNKVLASALSDAAKNFNITVHQLFLEKGHTMMEVDSVHATLEKYFYPPINSPSDYVARMRLARPAQPYNVKVVDYSFFKNFEASCSLNSLRPGRRSGDPTVNQIRQLKYTSEGTIFYTLDFSENWTILPHRRKSTALNSIPPLYTSPRPILRSKYDHLQQLKSVIESDHHAFYDSLIFYE